MALSVGGQLLVPLSGIVFWWAIACPIIWHCLLVGDCLSHYLALSVGGRLLVPLSGIGCWWAIACPIIDCVCGEGGGGGGSKNKGSKANYYTNYNTEKGEGTDTDMSNYVWKETLRMVKLRKVCVCVEGWG